MLPLLLSLLLLTPPTSAATCYEGTGLVPNIDQAWDLRTRICGTNACSSSDSARGDNHFCRLALPFNNGRSFVDIQRNDPSGLYKNCWVGTENILKECMANANGEGFTSGVPNGNWREGDEWYWVTVNNTDAGEMPLDLGDENVGQTGVDGYMFGPNSYCEGLSPGGGSTCIDIPDGCYIAVPESNYVPEVICSIPADLDDGDS
ncbi:hypothetical protein EJ04DRAFT_527470 [Polyplosphaeria fusca]|uniref:Uncharacterized protein n=1 Tax=Polyplosphaeria fusca TaxID=682080 RepID=A0A9P4UYG0_9PLEO|nr:hypothetical protein EJ04DRAFT_527470 [Polyplosphaeria fusca]